MYTFSLSNLEIRPILIKSKDIPDSTHCFHRHSLHRRRCRGVMVHFDP